MAVTTSANIMTSGSLWEFIRRVAIRNFEANLFFKDVAQNVELPIAYNKYSFPTVDNKDWSAAQLTEGTTPSEVGFNLTNVEVTLLQYGSHAILSDVVLTDSPVPAIQEAAVELGRDLANKVDAVIQDTVDAGTNVIYVGQTSRAAITASDTMNAIDLAKSVNLLKANDAPTFDGGSYVTIMHPHVYHDLQIESGTGTFIDVNKYSEPENIMNGEIWMLYGTRIVISSNVQFYADGGSGTVDVYPTYVVGRNAYGVVMSGWLQTFVEGLWSAGTDDPLHQRSTVAVKARIGTGILKNEALYRIEAASSLWANT